MTLSYKSSHPNPNKLSTARWTIHLTNVQFASQSRHPLTGVATRLQVSCVCRLQAVCCAAAEDTHPSSHCWGLFKCMHRQVCARWLDYDYVTHLSCRYQLHMRGFTACRGCCWFDIRQRTDLFFFYVTGGWAANSVGVKINLLWSILVLDCLRLWSTLRKEDNFSIAISKVRCYVKFTLAGSVFKQQTESPVCQPP